MFYQQMWRGMDQDSRESAATTIIHRKTQRNEKVKFQKHNKSDWKKTPKISEIPIASWVEKVLLGFLDEK